MNNFKVGDRVRIVGNESESDNPLGSVGIISYVNEYDEDCRVVVKGYTDDNLANWSPWSEIVLDNDLGNWSPWGGTENREVE